MKEKRKVIIDCDNTMGLPRWEVDDGLVILYLLGREDVEILGITNTFGNGSLRDVVHYTELLLAEIGRKDIPRFTGEPYCGQNEQLTLDIRAGDRYDNELDRQPFPSEAAVFLAEQAALHPGEITVLALGPVGNLHDAARLDPGFYANLKEIVVMGGYTGRLLIGEVDCRELNLSCNPEAALSMLNAACEVTVFNGHICLQAPFTAQHMSLVEFWPESRVRIIKEWLEQFSEYFRTDCFYLWDLLPAVYVSHPELFDNTAVELAPTLESMKYGMLQPVDTTGRGEEADRNRDPDRSLAGTIVVNMPSNILDYGRFMEILAQGWIAEWQMESAGWQKDSAGWQKDSAT